jgi:hypothetical protein
VAGVDPRYEPEGQPPPARAGGAGEEGGGEEGEGRAGAGGPARAPATGGLVELRADDLRRMKRDGDAWVVMFYAPWCASRGGVGGSS